MKLLIFSGSQREGRTTHRVALLLNQLFTQAGFDANVVDTKTVNAALLQYTLADHPEPPQVLVELKQQMDAADAMILVSPEYNGSFSPALKNLLDYFPKSTYERKPMGVATVSTGALGGIRAALQLQQVILALFGYPTFRMLTIGNVEENIDELGNALTASTQKKATEFVNEFSWFAKRLRG